mmetsp:Transcript_38588/g.94937  ORF Transcript_38588/g.94937 Transcript_38588/m.94937 type:complete len:215 (-) Transcript_38588:277-921(-)
MVHLEEQPARKSACDVARRALLCMDRAMSARDGLLGGAAREEERARDVARRALRGRRLLGRVERQRVMNEGRCTGEHDRRPRLPVGLRPNGRPRAAPLVHHGLLVELGHDYGNTRDALSFLLRASSCLLFCIPLLVRAPALIGHAVDAHVPLLGLPAAPALVVPPRVVTVIVLRVLVRGAFPRAAAWEHRLGGGSQVVNEVCLEARALERPPHA